MDFESVIILLNNIDVRADIRLENRIRQKFY